MSFLPSQRVSQQKVVTYKRRMADDDDDLNVLSQFLLNRADVVHIKTDSCSLC